MPTSTSVVLVDVHVCLVPMLSSSRARAHGEHADRRPKPLEGEDGFKSQPYWACYQLQIPRKAVNSPVLAFHSSYQWRTS